MYLNCHTGLSFKYGMLPIKTLFAEAKRCGVHKLALTEINNVASYLEMLRICEENKPRANGLTKFDKEPYELEIAVGIEFRGQENELLYIGLAQNNIGFERLNRFLSIHNHEDKRLPSRPPEMENVFFIFPYRKLEPEQLRSNEFIGVRVHELHAFSIDLSKEEFKDKFVAWHPVTFLPPEKVTDDKTKKDKLVYRDHNAHRLLRCIANNTLLSKLPEHQQALKEEFMMPEAELVQKFERFPELISNSKKLLDQCSIVCEMGVDKNKKASYGSVEEDMRVLREKTLIGYDRIYAKDDPERKIWKRAYRK